MVYNIGICDDDDMTLKLNKIYLDEFSKNNQLNIVHNLFSTGEKIISYAKRNLVDIALLDIDLKELSGIEVAKILKRLNKNIVIVFITAYGEYALEACNNLEACAFITKPFKQDKFSRNLKKAIIQATAVKENILSCHLIITEENIKKKIFQENILYIEKEGSQCIIKTYKKQYKVYETVTALMDRLENYFIRINQGVIVNLKEVDEIRGNDVILKSGKILSIGRTYKKDVKKRWIETPQE